MQKRKMISLVFGLAAVLAVGAPLSASGTETCDYYQNGGCCQPQGGCCQPQQGGYAPAVRARVEALAQDQQQFYNSLDSSRQGMFMQMSMADRRKAMKMSGDPNMNVQKTYDEMMSKKQK
jgi:hypothetical protein